MPERPGAPTQDQGGRAPCSSTAPGAEQPPSDALVDFAFEALDVATDAVIPTGGPMAPFSVVDIAGARSLNRFVGDFAEGHETARAQLKATHGVRLAAVAWDGYLTLDDERMDAVFVEASEAGDRRSVVFAQPYRASGTFRKRFSTHGNPALVERRESLLDE